MRFLFLFFILCIFTISSKEIYLPFPDKSSEPSFEELEKKFLEEDKKAPITVKKKKKTSKRKKRKKKKEKKIEVIDLSKANFEKGVFYFNNGEVEKAKEFFEKSAKMQGAFSEQAKIELSKITKQIKQEENLEDEVKWQSSFERAKSFHQKNPEQSKAIYLDMITQAPEKYKSIALIAISNLMIKDKKYEEAKNYLLTALNQYPKHSKRDLVTFYLAEVETRLGNLNQARKYYQKFETKEFENSIYKEIVKDKLRNIEY